VFSVYFTDSDDARDTHQEIYYEAVGLVMLALQGAGFTTPPTAITSPAAAISNSLTNQAATIKLQSGNASQA